ncbi:hypothetical protein PSET11_02177 [Arthrobacter ulcerisalmonis]|uniref:Uncharacterized protein n=1 Tax=Arthrobacter ulcerisalmonis TaxID=2483813 RepID=A0A3P5XCI2_9MICC|nr:hypothetical protein [Arthrobacter ulcerisalmonis]VDC28563.1 hypothetical protein PSET11_02177 [Arthrobacter ulcerisalmonis]
MGRHSEAVEATLTAAGDAITGKHQALCELVRTLAEQCDATPEGPGTRLAGTYLTAIRTLNAVVAAVPAQGTKPRNGLASVRGIRDAPKKSTIRGGKG